MSEAPPERRVYVKSGTVMASPRGYGHRRLVRDVLLRRRGRPRDPRVPGWATRIEGAEYQHLGSLREKVQALTWDDHLENGGDPDITPREFAKLVKARRKALMRYKKRS